jgi:hypothetical protein
MKTTTTVSNSGSDALELGLLGFAGLLILLAIFYDRLSKIVGPGGFELDLTPTTAKHAGTILAGELSKRSGAAVDRAGRSPRAIAALDSNSQLHRLVRSGGRGQADVSAIIESAARVVAQAGSQMTRYAQDLLRRADDAKSLTAFARTLGINDPDEIADLEVGVIRDSVWRRLADRALTDYGIPASTESQ